ncbi:hypothetical protein V5799_007044 [Amblyomma americanum]|uniref:Uncharacterized protein n=1 Tax=Amblyomma americanum TaxID=6943 RepID=A0AAQ4DUN4_AMBAM
MVFNKHKNSNFCPNAYTVIIYFFYKKCDYIYMHIFLFKATSDLPRRPRVKGVCSVLNLQSSEEPAEQLRRLAERSRRWPLFWNKCGNAKSISTHEQRGKLCANHCYVFQDVGLLLSWY